MQSYAVPIADLSSAKFAPGERILAFDFTKGILVLFMVLYHWLNYFVSPFGDYYKYLRFLTPSFIFITGFLISYVHFAKYGVGSVRLSRRLLLRGLKILALFTALNALICVLFADSPMRRMLSGNELPEALSTIFLTGNLVVEGIGKTAAFSILVPIGYLLIASAFILLACRLFKYSFHLVCGVLLASIVLLSLRGIESANLELLTIGLIGVICGYATSSQIENLMRRAYVVVLLYAAYLAAITRWGTPLVLRISGVFLTTMLIYTIGARLGQNGFAYRRMILLGKYSLFGYISQIAILQILRRLLNDPDLGYGLMAVSFVAGFTLTMISVEVLDWLRPRSVAVEKLYRVVFA
jgi:peptidoglycan/LPS O-acetylase OafA/YrhL